MQVRYIASWVERDESPPEDFDPDAVVYGRVIFPTLEDAQKYADKRGKARGILNWTQVLEETFNPELGIPARSDAAWDVTARWYGDWSGEWTEDR